MKIGIVGCGGKMGKTLVRQAMMTPGCVLVGGAESPQSETIGRDLGEVAGLKALGQTVLKDAEVLFERSQAVIDFTLPQATADHASLAVRHGVSLVVGDYWTRRESSSSVIRGRGAGSRGLRGEYESRGNRSVERHRAGNQSAWNPF